MDLLIPLLEQANNPAKSAAEDGSDHFPAARSIDPSAGSPRFAEVPKITVRSADDLPVVLEALNMADSPREVVSMLGELRLLVAYQQSYRRPMSDRLPGMPPERRRSARQPLQTDLCTLETPRLQDALVYDISTDGLRLESADAVEVGAVLALDVRIDGSAFRVNGTVVWRRLLAPELKGSGPSHPVSQLGIRFENLSGEGLEAIRALGESKTSDSDSQPSDLLQLIT